MLFKWKRLSKSKQTKLAKRKTTNPVVNNYSPANAKTEQQQELVAKALANRWLANHFILVDETITPKDLTQYQKLIVLKTSEGTLRCVVDFALLSQDNWTLHTQSLRGKVDLQNQSYTRFIDENINTKLIPYQDQRLPDHLVKSLAKFLNESVKEFLEYESYTKSGEQTLLKLHDETSIIYLQQDPNFDLSLIKQFSPAAVDDIDQVLIPEALKAHAQKNWQEVDLLLQKENRCNEREQGVLPYDLENMFAYVPKLQPLFRSFFDAFWMEQSNVKPAAATTNDNPIDWPAMVDQLLPEPARIPTLVSNTSYLQQVLKPSPVVKNEPTVTTFFKNEVIPLKNVWNEHYQQARSYVFYQKDHNFKYKKIYLNRKKRLFTVLKTAL